MNNIQHYTGIAIVVSGQKQQKLINWLFMDFLERGVISDEDAYSYHDKDIITGNWLRTDGVIIMDNKQSQFDIKEGILPTNLTEIKNSYKEKHMNIYNELQKYYNIVTIETVSYEYYT
jgi:hypothetical protein